MEGAIRGDAVEPVPACVHSVRAGIRSVIADFFGDDISTHMLTSAGLATVKMKFERDGVKMRCRRLFGVRDVHLLYFLRHVYELLLYPHEDIHSVMLWPMDAMFSPGCVYNVEPLTRAIAVVLPDGRPAVAFPLNPAGTDPERHLEECVPQYDSSGDEAAAGDAAGDAAAQGREAGSLNMQRLRMRMQKMACG